MKWSVVVRGGVGWTLAFFMGRGRVWLTEELEGTFGGVVWLLRSRGSHHVVNGVGFDDLHGDRDRERHECLSRDRQ
jgi:hypothetical protein